MSKFKLNQYIDGIVVCKFVTGVRRSDAVELAEPFEGASLIGFYDECIDPPSPATAEYAVSVGSEELFVEYASDDVMVFAACRSIKIIDPDNNKPNE